MNLKEKIRAIYSQKTALLFLTSVICATILGFLSGVLYHYYTDSKKTPITFIPDVNPKVPFLELLAVEDDTLYFKSKEHGIRFQISNDFYDSTSDTTFKIHYDPTALLKAFQDNQPQDIKELNTACNFLASKTGKIAYPKSEPKGQKLKTPRCFPDEESVLDAGLTIYEN